MTLLSAVNAVVIQTRPTILQFHTIRIRLLYTLCGWLVVYEVASNPSPSPGSIVHCSGIGSPLVPWSKVQLVRVSGCRYKKIKLRKCRKNKNANNTNNRILCSIAVLNEAGCWFADSILSIFRWGGERFPNQVQFSHLLLIRECIF